MRWHCATRVSRKKKGGSHYTSIFDVPSAKPHRRLQSTEAYIRLYYDSRIMEPVRQHIADTDLKGPMIHLIRKIAKEMYEAEDTETREAVEAYIEKIAQEQLKDPTLDTVEPTPALYQQYVFTISYLLFANLSKGLLMCFRTT